MRYRDIEDPELIDYLISSGEAVEYGDPWSWSTTHEYWTGEDGVRRARMVMTYHGGGNRGDDDEAEYAIRLLATGRAVRREDLPDPATRELPPEVTHIVRRDGRAARFRYYMPPPEGVA